MSAQRFRRVRRRSWSRPLGVLTLLLAAALIFGFVRFLAKLPTATAAPDRPTDAIVVLTGGTGRIHAGLELLDRGMARVLFVSGVNESVVMEELLRAAERHPEEFDCCIELGYQARDTRGNAREVADWMDREGYTSLRLVTAAYHMPRSLLELRRTLPEAEVIPHPVFPDGFRQGDWWHTPRSTGLLVSEYIKYLAASLRHPLPATDEVIDD